jgi:CBS domain-containing protein
MTQLEQAITTNPLTVSSDTNVAEAILQMSAARASCSLKDDDDIDSDSNLLMSETRSSCVIIVEGTKLLGIFTERDVVHLSANGYKLAETKISEVIAQPVITLRKSDFTDIFAALTLLQSHHIRHLPIVDDYDQLIGLVTHESLRQLLHPVDLLRSQKRKISNL